MYGKNNKRGKVKVGACPSQIRRRGWLMQPECALTANGAWNDGWQFTEKVARQP